MEEEILSKGLKYLLDWVCEIENNLIKWIVIIDFLKKMSLSM